MGKAVPKGVKTKAEILLNEMHERFSKDFEKNKKVLGELDFFDSKKTRNLVAGYITRKIKEEST